MLEALEGQNIVRRGERYIYGNNTKSHNCPFAQQCRVGQVLRGNIWISVRERVGGTLLLSKLTRHLL